MFVQLGIICFTKCATFYRFSIKRSDVKQSFFFKPLHVCTLKQSIFSLFHKTCSFLSFQCKTLSYHYFCTVTQSSSNVLFSIILVQTITCKASSLKLFHTIIHAQLSILFSVSPDGLLSVILMCNSQLQSKCRFVHTITFVPLSRVFSITPNRLFSTIHLTPQCSC